MILIRRIWSKIFLFAWISSLGHKTWVYMLFFYNKIDLRTDFRYVCFILIPLASRATLKITKNNAIVIKMTACALISHVLWKKLFAYCWCFVLLCTGAYYVRYIFCLFASVLSFCSWAAGHFYAVRQICPRLEEKLPAFYVLQLLIYIKCCPLKLLFDFMRLIGEKSRHDVFSICLSMKVEPGILWSFSAKTLP